MHGLQQNLDAVQSPLYTISFGSVKISLCVAKICRVRIRLGFDIVLLCLEHGPIA